MALTLSETIYYVSDLEAAVRFYVDRLGFELVEREEWGWACLAKDGARVGLLPAKFASDSKSPRLSFKTEDLEAEVERLSAAGADCDPIRGDKGTMRGINFRDADGNAYFLWEEGGI